MSKPSKEEIQAIMAEELRMDGMAQAMTEAERLHIMDMGFYNESIKGYLVRAMKNAEFSREDIAKALGGLRWAFDEITASEAAEEYRKF